MVKTKSPTYTKLWLDTEFNGFGGEFISAALVGEDGQYWYKTIDCKTPIPWTATHVMPRLGIEPTSFDDLQESLRQFLNQFKRIVIIADWPTDIEHFCNLLSVRPHNGSIIHTPPLTFEIKTGLNGKGTSAVPHNALEDARSIMRYDLASS